MNTPKLCKQLLTFFVCFAFVQASAQNITGIVTDTSGRPLAFAAVKLGETQQGVIADLNGKFKFNNTVNAGFITVSHVGYTAKKVFIKDSIQLVIELEPAANNLNEVVVASNSNKLKRILNTALNNRSVNNPDKYEWYQCNIYYKVVFDVLEAPSTYPRPQEIKVDSARAKKLEELRKKQHADTNYWKKIDTTSHHLFENQHMFITETISRRTWERPEKLQEQVIASRMSGFQKPLFTFLVTDVLPFHVYNDYITLNAKDYHNPISSGMFQRFDFRIEDEIQQGKDTLWLISFQPRRNPEQLSGTVYISSNKFAIAHIAASNKDTALNRVIGIEQQYQLIEDKWFPQQLNYYIRWNSIGGSTDTFVMKGTSLIDSIVFSKDKDFRFDKAHTIKLNANAGELHDSTWQSLRPVPLDKKEARTYVFLDSVGKKHHFDRIGKYLDKIIDGFFPLGALDVALNRIYSYNLYENNRVGLGLQTNEKISKKFTVGGWFGYGTGDKMWKYGAYSELYLSPERDFTLRLAYNNDLRDPGRLQIHKELDKNFVRSFLIGRADNVQGYSIAVKKRIGYWENTLSYVDEFIYPKYTYAFEDKGQLHTAFHTKELSFNFRYAYAERMAPLFGRYYSLGSKYPVIYGKLTAGNITNTNTEYLQAIAAVNWRKHINKIGDEKFLLIGGKNFSQKPLPLSKLFAGNGFLNEDRAIYTFGGMQTMFPYQYYPNQFINFYWSHEFDFRFYTKKLFYTLSSSPSLSFGYNVLWGSLKDTAVHKLVNFSIPDPAYHEGGLLINRLLRLKFIGMYYFNFNAGYFYHFNGPFDHNRNGKFVFGISADF